jgi:tRNA pseudouridine38-40 synthase
MYKAILCYDGTCYYGWQETVTGPSIQEELKKALHRITGQTHTPEAASRTDRGVHARGQVIQFSLVNSQDPIKLLRALNAVLPSDIRVLELVHQEFHPTLDAIGKEYHYQLQLGPVHDPMTRLYAWHIHHDLDQKKMEQAMQDLIGTHDFTAFANEPEKDPICTLESIEYKADRFVIRGNRFLYKMVRNLVGTLVYIGMDKLPPDSIPQILQSRDRKLAGITAPAHGLYLHQVFYGVK